MTQMMQDAKYTISDTVLAELLDELMPLSLDSVLNITLAMEEYTCLAERVFKRGTELPKKDCSK
jgi:hypothetical protein